MVQSESNKTQSTIQIPRRSFTVEFFVGVFAILGVLAAAYLSVGLGGLELGSGDTYKIQAEFDNISGLQLGASVEIGGVPVGEVTAISLADPAALVTMNINNSLLIKDDDVFSIRTKGIIGDRYVKISRGGSNITLPTEGGKVTETESVVDIEDVIGKIVHSMTDSDDDDDAKKESDKKKNK